MFKNQMSHMTTVCVGGHSLCVYGDNPSLLKKNHFKKWAQFFKGRIHILAVSLCLIF